MRRLRPRRPSVFSRHAPTKVAALRAIRQSLAAPEHGARSKKAAATLRAAVADRMFALSEPAPEEDGSR
jgi:hypothetical protein